MTRAEQTDCGYAGSRRYAYGRGCRCDACRAGMSKYKRENRAAGAAWVDRERETSRAWKERNRDRNRERDRAYWHRKHGTVQP